MILVNVNPFKVGDRVIYLPFQDGTIVIVRKIEGVKVYCSHENGNNFGWDCHTFFRRVN